MKYPNDLIVRKDALDVARWWQKEYPEHRELGEIEDDIDHLPSVTEEEFMKAAKEMGFVCFKRKEWVSLLKCPICGKKPWEWGDAFNTYYECQNGCMAGGKGNRRQVRVLWNKAVEEYEG